MRIIRGFLLVPLVFAWLAFSPIMRAVDPPPDGGYANENTAEGDFALFSLSIGSDNTAIGNGALFRNTTGSFNTASGASALESNTTGSANTANGYESLFSNTTGIDNTASGVFALFDNTTGTYNTATGNLALYSNTSGGANTATGYQALNLNTTGADNTANGIDALQSNTTGNYNTANGSSALAFNSTGYSNTATGLQALAFNATGNNNTAEGQNALIGNTSGSNNIALGSGAGSSLTTGNNNIDIGNGGVAGESNTTRIGTSGTQTATFIAGIRGVAVAGGQPVAVNANGQLGIRASSARFKEAIKAMDKASEAILSLQPVTFRYKKELDPEGVPQFGLVAEQVAKVNPDLVARDDQGKPFTVRYDEVNAMLLNEFLKEHRKVETLERKMAQQQEEFRSVTSQLRSALKEQAAQIQKVSDQILMTRPSPRLAVNNQ
jgi:trimeric autotransporter adhesin